MARVSLTPFLSAIIHEQENQWRRRAGKQASSVIIRTRPHPVPPLPTTIIPTLHNGGGGVVVDEKKPGSKYRRPVRVPLSEDVSKAPSSQPTDRCAHHLFAVVRPGPRRPWGPPATNTRGNRVGLGPHTSNAARKEENVTAGEANVPSSIDYSKTLTSLPLPNKPILNPKPTLPDKTKATFEYRQGLVVRIIN